MFTSLRSRLWLTYAVVVGVVLLISTVTILAYLVRNPIADRREVQRLRILATIVVQRSQMLDSLPEEFDVKKIEVLLNRLDTTTGARVAIFSPQGELIGDSRAHNSPPLPEWSQLNQTSFGVLPTFRDENGTRWLFTLTRMEQGYFFLLASPRSRFSLLGVFRDELLGEFVRGAVVGLFFSLLLAFWIAHWISHPLHNITRAARSVPEGEFQQIPVEEGPKEVRELAAAFNEMVSRVHHTQKSQQDFIANVSHDLKTPLTSIQGYAQAIIDGAVMEAAEVQKAAQVIYGEAEHMNEMVSDLLELARLDSGMATFEREPVYLKELLNLVLDQFNPLARHAGIKLKLNVPTHLSTDEVTVLGDAERLSQLFSNLIDNAIKFSPPGGEVTLVLGREDQYVVIKVVDQGPGIPPDEVERIFERFYQTDKARTGGGRRSVGLGLAIAREIAEKHGGRIMAYNRSFAEGSSNASEQASTGAVFVVHLPLLRPAEASASKKSRPGKV